ncbi:hypothetical protein FQA39_LY08742 [Lamprigera yunnana]|nr:hypothetical protein FQA39_LY08742 [Lamprigera yunnana]
MILGNRLLNLDSENYPLLQQNNILIFKDELSNNNVPDSFVAIIDKIKNNNELNSETTAVLEIEPPGITKGWHIPYFANENDVEQTSFSSSQHAASKDLAHIGENPTNLEEGYFEDSDDSIRDPNYKESSVEEMESGDEETETRSRNTNSGNNNLPDSFVAIIDKIKNNNELNSETTAVLETEPPGITKGWHLVRPWLFKING